MSFDDIPEDYQESFSCPQCHQGSVTQNIISGDWECDSCEFKSAPQSGESDE
jgi:ribosomal protein L37AE/L43A